MDVDVPAPGQGGDPAKRIGGNMEHGGFLTVEFSKGGSPFGTRAGKGEKKKMKVG